MPPDFDEVQLTNEQIEQLVFDERCRIYFDAKSLQKKNISHNDRLEAKRLLSADELKSYMIKKYPDFVLDEFSEPIFNLLCLYFSIDKRFEQMGEGYSLYKGIALMGLPGCGKTHILQLFSRNRRQCHHLININDINERCKKDGIDAYKMFTAQVAGWGNDRQFYYQPYVVWAIDDVGLEEPVNDYGNKAFVFSKIIQERYANKHLMQYYPLHITSMLTAEQIGEKYGDFVRSRMREQFNTIQYKGKDRRK
jgi:DNA replication protein DnaC